jgi:hypothetical protein
MGKHVLEKIVGSEWGKRKYPARRCHSTRGNVSRGITPSCITRVFGEYFLKISVHKNS